MSNGGWQPPQPSDIPQPPAQGDHGAPSGGFAPPGQGTAPTQPVPLESGGPPGRSRGKAVAAGVGVAAILGAGIFAVTRVSGDSASGGASSPEEAGAALVEAYGNEDVLGAIDLLLPGERETLRDPVSELVEELRRLEVLSGDADLSDVGGLDVEITDSSVETDETNVEDIVNLFITVEGTVTVNGEELPIGDLILDNVDADLGELDTADEDASGEFPLTVVEEDGRWYVSLFHTAAEQLRQRSQAGDIPTTGIEPVGADDPEDAFDAFFDGIASLEVEQMIASLNPDEFAALQRYAPLFVDDAQDELDGADIDVSFDEPQYTVSGEGDTRSMTVTYLSGDISAEGERVSFTWEGGCLTITPPPDVAEEAIDTCEIAGELPSMDDMFGDSADDVEDFLGVLGAAFEDYENPGIIVKQVDGSWFLSPMATGSEQVLAILRALERDEIEQIIEDGQNVFDEVFGGLDVPYPDDPFVEDPFDDGPTVVSAPDVTATELTVPDISVAVVTAPDASDFTIPDITVPDVTAPDVSVPDLSVPDSEGLAQCYIAETGAEASTCYADLVASGEIEESEVPIYLRFPECGLGDLYHSGDYYTLADAEFVAAATNASPCFLQHAAAGTIEELELPVELSDPQCLQGRNWYAAFDDDDYFDALIDCAYG